MTQTIHPEMTKDSKIVVIDPNSTVMAACRLMVENRVGAVIVKDKGELLGIFTERDLMNKIVYKGRDPAKVLVKEVMTPDPETIHFQADPFTALEMMNEKKYRHLPVIDDQGRVISVLSIRNLYKMVQSELEHRISERESFIFGAPYALG